MFHPDPRFVDDTDSADAEPQPCAATLVACTLALMTAWADAEPNNRLDVASQRRLMARKIVSNLFFLRHHPALDENLRRVVANVHERWVPMAQGMSVAADGADLVTRPPGTVCH